MADAEKLRVTAQKWLIVNRIATPKIQWRAMKKRMFRFGERG
ncbi:MAG TPA: hypothetical protein VKW70_05080 [Terriglobia bacterium]|nr:hypothetical protein [Terriglobia bacterium]